MNEPMTAPQPATKPLRRDVLIAAVLRRVRRRHGRRGLCRGAALQLVLPRHRLWRHHAGRAAARPSRCSAARSPCASTPMSRPACRGGSSRSRTRSSCASARWRPSTTRSSTRPRARSPRRRPTTSRRRQVGAYFDKINCFCFTEQTLKPGETREMAVVFYVDPEIAKDRDQDDAQHHHAVLHLLPAARAAAAGGGGAGPESKA